MTHRALRMLLLGAYRRTLRSRLRRRPGAAPLERALRELVARGHEASLRSGRQP